ncbi:MAG TPA: ABC transporter ATP-binding protein [Bacteroidales bacterium]|nr:ABC transporter ATP-binding protein [Bacteroidales bacterium]
MISVSDEILSINSLVIGYNFRKRSVPLLPPVTASADKGELVALLGRNGIGKSTLLRSVTGLQKPLEGSVRINNEDALLFSRVKFARSVGYISTEIVKVSHMRVYDLVALGRFPYTDWIGRIDQKTDELIKGSIVKAGLADYNDRFISELSDGERQRAMIARVLAQDTDIMIMDEPLAFLDISGKYSIIRLMKELTAGGKTIIFSTHDFNIAVNHSDRIWLMNDHGLKEGAPEDLWLGNEFECLFDSEHTGFNPEDGSFLFGLPTRGKIFLEGGDGRLRYWTVKALKRAGFTITKKNDLPCKKLHVDNSGWIFSTGDTTKSYKTLYELVKQLKNQ